MQEWEYMAKTLDLVEGLFTPKSREKINKELLEEDLNKTHWTSNAIEFILEAVREKEAKNSKAEGK